MSIFDSNLNKILDATYTAMDVEDARSMAIAIAQDHPELSQHVGSIDSEEFNKVGDMHVLATKELFVTARPFHNANTQLLRRAVHS